MPDEMQRKNRSGAELLREAAAKMRERAQEALYDARFAPHTEWAHLEQQCAESVEPFADHVRFMTPAVALAVADWLDNVRVEHEYDADGDITRYCSSGPEQAAALAVARAYLGSES